MRIQFSACRSAASFLMISLIGLVSLFASPASASPITVTGVFQFLDNRSINDAGITSGVIIEYGATHVLPNGSNGTTGYATRGIQNRPLTPQDYTANADFFSGGRPDTGAQDSRGSWTLNFTNGADTATVHTPSVSNSLSPLPFVNNVAISGNGLTPSISWVNTAAGINTVAIKIRDNGQNSNQGGGYTANLIYQQYLTPTSTFAVPTGLLQAGHEYSIEIDQVVLRNPAGAANFPNTLNQSRTFIDFSATTGVSSNPVYLPFVGTQTNGAPSYTFDITNVSSTQTTYIDPQVATGYNFKTGANDPNFRTVTLPLLVGTNSYTILLPNGQQVTVLPGQTFDFTSISAYLNGLSNFEVIGINPNSSVNPYDPEAFVVGLTFMSNGSFTGSMDPIIADTVAAVPEPSTWAMMILGFAGISVVARRRKSTVFARSLIKHVLLGGRVVFWQSLNR